MKACFKPFNHTAFTYWNCTAQAPFSKYHSRFPMKTRPFSEVKAELLSDKNCGQDIIFQVQITTLYPF